MSATPQAFEEQLSPQKLNWSELEALYGALVYKLMAWVQALTATPAKRRVLCFVKPSCTNSQERRGREAVCTPLDDFCQVKPDRTRTRQGAPREGRS